MRLIEVELWNVCQHGHRLVKFDAGLTALVGPNGSGKTNLISAVYAGITGDFSRFELNKQGLISQFAKKDDKSGIRVLMEHHGVRAEVVRMLRPNTRSLVIGDQPVITAEKQIAAKIEEWFGLPIKVIGQYIFVSQWQMFALLNESAADRAKDLYRLFDLVKAETCHTLLGDKLTELGRQSLGVLDIEAIRARMLANRGQLRELEKKQKYLAERDASSVKTDALEAKVKAWNHKNDLAIKISRLGDMVDSLSDEVTGHDNVIAGLENDLQTVQQTVEVLSGRLESAKQDMANWETYNQAQLSKNKLMTEIEQTEKHLSMLLDEYKTLLASKPDVYLSTEEREKAEPRLKEMSDRLAVLEVFLNNIDGDTQACPACFTPMSAIQDRYAEYSAEHPVVNKALADLKTAVSRSIGYDNIRTRTDQKIEAADKKIEFLKQTLEAIPSIDRPRMSSEDIQQIRNAYLLNKQKADQINKVLTIKTKERSITEGNWQARIADLQNLSAEYDGIEVTAIEAGSAQAVLDVRRLESQQKSQIQAEIAVIKRAITDDEVAIEEAAKTVKRLELLNKWKEQIVEVRDIMHRDALPKMIAQSYLEKLEYQMNTSLEELGVDFRVKSQDGLKFEVSFSDGVRKVPAEALSGGEKVVFALAWRLAVNAEFASDIGVLCLDEPTAGLDRDRLDCLRLAIEQMRTMSKSRGLQCIIITHSEELMPLFDQVIELRPPTAI